MLRVLSLLIAAVIAILLVAFLVANWHTVLVSFDPFQGARLPAVSVTQPLAIVLFVTFLFGMLFGWIVGWIGQGSWRREARHQRRRARMERREKERLQARLGEDEDDYAARIGLPAPR